MAGIRIRHRTKRSCIATVPILSKPYKGPHPPFCPHCGVFHPVQTIHLWLDDTGSVTVSRGVFDTLNTEWTGPPEYDIVGEVKDPPALRIGGKQSRQEQDQESRKITFLRVPKLKEEAR